MLIDVLVYEPAASALEAHRVSWIMQNSGTARLTLLSMEQTIHCRPGELVVHCTRRELLVSRRNAAKLRRSLGSISSRKLLSQDSKR